VLSPFRGGGIAYLSDPDSCAGWSFYTPGWASHVRQVEGYSLDKVAGHSSLPLYFPIILLI